MKKDKEVSGNTTKLSPQQKEIYKSDLFYFDCKVVSRNVITDWVQGIRNLLGLELKAYTNIIDTTVRELQSKINVPLKWFRIDIEQMTKGSFLISIYGEKK